MKDNQHPGNLTSKSFFLKHLLEDLGIVKKNFDIQFSKKDKLKKTAFLCSKEMNKYKTKFRNCELDLKEKSQKSEELEKRCVDLKNRLIVYEEKIEKYKKMELNDINSLRKSSQSVTSEALNTKLISQNQEILERLHKEENRNRGLQAKVEAAEERRSEALRKVFNLKMELNMLQKSQSVEDRSAEVEELETKVAVLESENKELMRQKEETEEERNKMRMMCDTYKTKLDEIIDEHNRTVTRFQEEIAGLEQMKVDAEAKESRLVKASSQLSESVTSSREVVKLKKIELDFELLKTEHAELTLNLLNTKEQHMLLLNKYERLKKKYKGLSLSLIKPSKTK